MTWRIVEISTNSKLEYKLNYLVVRNTEGVRKVFLPEIAVLIIESTAVSITASLLSEVIKRKIKVIFCDEKHNPQSELIPYYGSHDVVRKLRLQNGWSETVKGEAWTRIVKDKISKQRDLLDRYGHHDKATILNDYLEQVGFNDSSNREGHAAKVYFNTIFGQGYSRGDPDDRNSALDYGYSIILSAFNREISIAGYHTEIGIFHDNTFNQFNLSSDLMEPFRPIIDDCVIRMGDIEFDRNCKQRLVNILNSTVIINDKENYLINAIRVYVQSFFDAMENEDVGRMVTYEVKIHESDGIL